MKLGLMTAALGGMDLDALSAWASSEGFQTLEVASWPRVTGDKRRYAGVSHIDVDALDDAGAAAIRRQLDDRKLEISSLAYYPNNLDPDPAVRAAAHEHLRKVVVAAQKLGCESRRYINCDLTVSPKRAAAHHQLWLRCRSALTLSWTTLRPFEPHLHPKSDGRVLRASVAPRAAFKRYDARLHVEQPCSAPSA